MGMRQRSRRDAPTFQKSALGQQEPFPARRLSGRVGWIPDLRRLPLGRQVVPGAIVPERGGFDSEPPIWPFHERVDSTRRTSDNGTRESDWASEVQLIAVTP